ncbi:hypothetical protein [Blastomonas sp.]|uniref:hypothetical protein n=1 Tax=Blastomonas sp. TaxID=1909299 RepID=UPI00359314C6
MTRFNIIISWRDHALAGTATLATAHAIGLIETFDWLPQGMTAITGLAGLMLAAAACGLVYALVLGLLYRRRLVAGPLYRCGESRPAEAYDKPYEANGDRLFDHWQYH